MKIEIFFDLSLNKNTENSLNQWKEIEIPKLIKTLSSIIKNPGFNEKKYNIVFIDDNEMKNLNYTYRKKNSTTDVLTFNYNDEITDNMTDSEIYISLEKAEKQAVEKKHTLENELTVLLLHGLLHSIGYDHERSKEDEKIMQTLEQQVLTLTGNENLKPLISNEI